MAGWEKSGESTEGQSTTESSRTVHPAVAVPGHWLCVLSMAESMGR